MKKLAPIILFAYNRLNETQETVKALQKNFLAEKSKLFIFSDGPKNNMDDKKIDSVRSYLYTIEGFKKVKIIESKINKGLASSIIQGVSEILDNYDSVIVLEDDLITSPNFLDFMNQALEFYQNNPKVISISGYTMNLPSLEGYNKDYYFGIRASSWGWATWKNQWEGIDWEVSDYSKFSKDIKQKLRFFQVGSDMPGMLRNQMEGKIDSWAIRWCYHQFKHDLYTVFATKSKINSIGFSEDATHTSGALKFIAALDDSSKRNFKFDETIILEKSVLRDFKAKFSILRRIKDKLGKMLANTGIRFGNHV